MKVTQNPPSHTRATEAAKATENKAAALKAKAEGALKSGSPREGSSVEISDDARLMNKASELVSATPDVRRDKVDALKASIQNGSYRVDSGAIADRILEEHLNSDFGKNNL